MATLRRRRNRDGSVSWDTTVRRVGHPTACKSFRTKLEAELWAGRTEARIAGRTTALVREMTVADLIDEALPRLKNPTAAIFNYWRDAIGTFRLADVTPALIATHRDRLLGQPTGGHGYRKLKPRSPATVRNYLIELSRLFSHAVKEIYVMDDNPCTKVAKPEASKWRVRFLDEPERKALLATCRESPSPDLYPYVLFCLTTGCRKGEAAALLWRNVDLKRRWAVFPTTKNGSARGVPLTPTVASLLEKRSRTDEKVFPVDITSAWTSAVAKAGIEDFRFHDLRHTAGSTLTMNGANAVEVATLLGHKTLDMVKRYSHLSSDHTIALVDRVMGGLA